METIEIQVEGNKHRSKPAILRDNLPKAFADLDVHIYEVVAEKNYNREKQIKVCFQPQSFAMDPLVVILMTQATLNFYGELYKFAGISTKVEYGYYDEAEAVVIFEYTAI